MSKYCSSCNKNLVSSRFFISNRKPLKYMDDCIECVKVSNPTLYEIKLNEPSEVARRIAEKYRPKNDAKRLERNAYATKWRKEHPLDAYGKALQNKRTKESLKRRTPEKIERDKARQKAYRAQNKYKQNRYPRTPAQIERDKATQKAYRARNKEKLKRYMQEYYKKNKDTMREKRLEREAKHTNKI